MSVYAVDTDILTLYQSGHPAVRQHVGRRRPGELAITVMSVEEQLSGWYRRDDAASGLSQARTADVAGDPPLRI
jgi:hypothetical protein